MSAMSTITASTPLKLLEAILAQLPSEDASADVVVKSGGREVEIGFTPAPRQAKPFELKTFEERREFMIERLKRRAVHGVGLSDWAVSREAIYSPDD